MNTCSKCGGRLAKPQVEPDLKPYYVFFRVPAGPLLRVLVYAVDRAHARELAPRIDRCWFKRGDTSAVDIERVEEFR